MAIQSQPMVLNVRQERGFVIINGLSFPYDPSIPGVYVIRERDCVRIGYLTDDGRFICHNDMGPALFTGDYGFLSVSYFAHDFPYTE